MSGEDSKNSATRAQNRETEMRDAKPDSPNEILSEAIKKNINNDVFEDLDSYNSVMTISQVVKYFNRHGMNSFTKTMIQNYVRVNVLPQPEDKRHYTKKHLFALAMTDSLKNSFSLEEIKELFRLSEAAGTAGFDKQDDYVKYLDELNKTVADISKDFASDEKISEILLKLMAKSVSYKLVAQSILETLCTCNEEKL